MQNVAKSMVEAECALGHDSFLVDCMVETPAWERFLDADVQVAHTTFPRTFKGKNIDRQLTKPKKLVVPFHGTPEHVFRGSVEAGLHGAYAPGNSQMIQQYDLKSADAVVTFWERHRWLYQTMVDKHTTVDLVPLGVDLAFWKAGFSRGKYQGQPSLWTGENAHDIKWPLDLFLLWPRVWPELDDACLHACYLPLDQHRYWFPLIHRNGAYYHAHAGSWTYPHEELRSIFKSVDFFIGLVQKGDHNRISMEANAAGATTISYAGNVYADYWLPEGDQRETAKALIAVCKGEVEKRAKTPVPDQSEMASAMVSIYERVLDAPKHSVSVAFTESKPQLATTISHAGKVYAAVKPAKKKRRAK